MQVIMETMRAVAGMTVLSVVAELLAPSERVRQHLRLICGFLLVLTVMQEIISGIRG